MDESPKSILDAVGAVISGADIPLKGLFVDDDATVARFHTRDERAEAHRLLTNHGFVCRYGRILSTDTSASDLPETVFDAKGRGDSLAILRCDHSANADHTVDTVVDQHIDPFDVHFSGFASPKDDLDRFERMVLEFAPTHSHEQIRELRRFANDQMAEWAARGKKPWSEAHWTKLRKKIGGLSREERSTWACALFEEIHTAQTGDRLNTAEDAQLQGAIDAAIEAFGRHRLQRTLDRLRSVARADLENLLPDSIDDWYKYAVFEIPVLHPDSDEDADQPGRIYWTNRDLIERSSRNSGARFKSDLPAERILEFLGPRECETAARAAKLPLLTAVTIFADIAFWALDETVDIKRLRSRRDDQLKRVGQ